MKKNKVLLNITSVFCFIYGAIYIFSLVFIPIGIYCFIAGKKFSYKADHLMDNYSVDKKVMKAYTTFASIACFPFGLLSIIAYLSVYGNNVKIQNSESEVNVKSENVQDSSESNQSKMAQENSNQEGETVAETTAEKLEKLEKLRNFRDKNIITEEEFEMAKNKMFGDEDKK